MRASRGLKWENKMYKLKRSIKIAGFFCDVVMAFMSCNIARDKQLCRAELNSIKPTV